MVVVVVAIVMVTMMVTMMVVVVVIVMTVMVKPLLCQLSHWWPLPCSISRSLSILIMCSLLFSPWRLSLR